ncbi:MAG TPA: hypothetical protein VFF00_10120 [Candidatus Elarobacter sp.]|nr:hypothetical protein [Dongiaceae bacterium]HZW54383.1 hypothetical protein [Candidatus Elarobacter sp.]
MLSRALAAAALICALAGCAQRGGGSAAAGTPVPSAYEAALRAKQAELVEADRASAARRRADVARVVTGSARDVTPASSMTERFELRLTNHGTRALRRVEGGVIVYGGAGLHRLGLASFSVKLDLAPGRSANVPVSIPLSAFAAEGAGALARASGTPKRVELELTGYAASDGAAPREAD